MGFWDTVDSHPVNLEPAPAADKLKNELEKPMHN